MNNPDVATGHSLASAPSQEPPIVEVRNLTRIYGDGTQIRALDGVSFSICRGEFVSVMGPSGSGKSTLLHLIGALDRPTSGQIIINGKDLTKVKDLDRFRGSEIGFVFQMHNLLPILTAVENVEVAMVDTSSGGGDRRKRARAALDLVGLVDRADHLPGELSGGERQRVAVARALADNPSIILADEPTGSLDSRSGREVLELFHRLNRENRATILVVTHNPLLALETDRIITMRDGKLVSDERVQTSYEDEMAALRGSTLGRLLFGTDELEKQEAH